MSFDFAQDLEPVETASPREEASFVRRAAGLPGVRSAHLSLHSRLRLLRAVMLRQLLPGRLKVGRRSLKPQMHVQVMPRQPLDSALGHEPVEAGAEFIFK